MKLIQPKYERTRNRLSYSHSRYSVSQCASMTRGGKPIYINSRSKSSQRFHGTPWAMALRIK